MDWMAEPAMIAKTGLGAVDHQRRTVDNFLEASSHHGDECAGCHRQNRQNLHCRGAQQQMPLEGRP
ncbi:hypothetical protein ACFYT3_31810 [Nocardia amikacinitolerans]|uniref:deazapurine DNA modification protein DpdA family protein n=1 Tax=Nocardia amikacinitolerans TaxID=756689 RepID=UPI0036BCEBE7